MKIGFGSRYGLSFWSARWQTSPTIMVDLELHATSAARPRGLGPAKSRRTTSGRVPTRRTHHCSRCLPLPTAPPLVFDRLRGTFSCYRYTTPCTSEARSPQQRSSRQHFSHASSSPRLHPREPTSTPACRLSRLSPLPVRSDVCCLSPVPWYPCLFSTLFSISLSFDDKVSLLFSPCS